PLGRRVRPERAAVVDLRRVTGQVGPVGQPEPVGRDLGGGAALQEEPTALAQDVRRGLAAHAVNDHQMGHDGLRIQTIHTKAKRMLARSVAETIKCVVELSQLYLKMSAKDYAWYKSTVNRLADMVANQRKGPAAKRDRVRERHEVMDNLWA